MSSKFGIWPRIVDLASDFECEYVTAAAWARRGEIPSKLDFQIIQKAKERGYLVTIEELSLWHARCAEVRAEWRSQGANEACPPVCPPLPATELKRRRGAEDAA